MRDACRDKVEAVSSSADLRCPYVTRAGRASGAARWAIWVGLLIVLPVVGCGEGGDVPSPVGTSPVAGSPVVTVGPSPTLDPEHVLVLAAYAEYLRVGTEMANRGDADDPRLAEVATGPALVQTRAAIRGHIQAGRRYEGSVRIVASEVVEFDDRYGARMATVQACVDISDYVLVHSDDGSPVDVDRGLERFGVVVEVILVADRWVVLAVDDRSLREVPCGP